MKVGWAEGKSSSVRYHRALKKHIYYFSQYFTEITAIVTCTGQSIRVPQCIKISLRIKLDRFNPRNNTIESSLTL